MKATKFELRYRTLVHQSIVFAALLTYLADPDDVVWRFVRHTATPQLLERYVFVAATLFIGVGAWICTWARVHCNRETSSGGPQLSIYLFRSREFGDFCYAVGLASLFPLWGFVMLVAGEAVRSFRLFRAEDGSGPNSQADRTPVRPRLESHNTKEFGSAWRNGFRQEAVKWGLLFSMIVFVFTLKDRIVEVLIGVSFLVGVLFNAPIFQRSQRNEPRQGERGRRSASTTATLKS